MLPSHRAPANPTNHETLARQDKRQFFMDFPPNRARAYLQQRHRKRHIAWRFELEAHPAGFRKHVMRIDAVHDHQLLTPGSAHAYIEKSMTMDVPELLTAPAAETHRQNGGWRGVARPSSAFFQGRHGCEPGRLHQTGPRHQQAVEELRQEWHMDQPAGAGERQRERTCSSALRTIADIIHHPEMHGAGRSAASTSRSRAERSHAGGLMLLNECRGAILIVAQEKLSTAR